MSSETPIAAAEAAQETQPTEAPGVNLERKARKEAQKALKAQQAAEKKAAKAKAAASSQASSSTTTTTTASSKDNNKAKAARKPQSPAEQLSRALAYLLRHGADKEGLAIRADGYILLRDVLERPRVKSVNMAETQGAKRRPELNDVQAVTASNDKKRFELLNEHDEWYVRAVQGHSLKQVVELEHTPLTLDNLHLLLHTPSHEDQKKEEEEDELAGEIDSKLNLDGAGTGVVEVIHGTYAAAWDEILASGGLKPMTRNHIHLAKGKFGAKGVVSGMRKSANRLIYVDIARALSDGIEFAVSSNGVVLTPGDGGGLLGLKYFTRVEDQRGEVVWSPNSSN